MFTERFNHLFKELHITTDLEFAGYVQCERSYINRLRSGSRTPKPDGKLADLLASGFYSYAKEKHMMRVLCKNVKCSIRSGQEEVEQAVKNYLYEGYVVRRAAEKKREAYDRRLAYKMNYKRNFARRFSEVMDIIQISNARLARLVNVDASVISRYKSGTTVPKKDSDIAGLLCRKLIQCVKLGNHSEEFCKYTGIASDILADDDLGMVALKNWLFEAGDFGVAVVKDFIDHFSDFSPNFSFKVLSLEECVYPDEDVSDHSNDVIYYDEEGLRRAALRLLREAVLGGVEELWLYSDNCMDWLEKDKEFCMKWASLMYYCVRAGMYIRIIHNVERSLNEMTEAVRMWTPLYMSGRIESYYNVKSNGERFSHTVFLAKGLASVVGCNIRNHTTEKVYSYVTNEKMLSHLENVYQGLMKNSRQLIKVNVEEDLTVEQKLEKEERRKGASVLELSDIRMEISDKLVVVSRKSEPSVEFVVAHPLVIFAFQDFANMKCKEMEKNEE